MPSPDRSPGAESLIERRIRDAIQRGEFDDLPGAGEPLGLLDEPYEPNWWVKRWVQREGLGPEMAQVLRNTDRERGVRRARRRRSQG